MNIFAIIKLNTLEELVQKDQENVPKTHPNPCLPMSEKHILKKRRKIARKKTKELSGCKMLMIRSSKEWTFLYKMLQFQYLS